MQTMREYAASLGLAQAGARGRLSREAHAAIEKARSEGMTFKDAAPSKPVVNTPRASKPVVDNPGPVDHVSMLRENHTPDTLFVGKDSTGKKHTVNARQVCRNSGYSLTSCPCGRTHEVLVGSLEFVPVRLK